MPPKPKPARGHLHGVAALLKAHESELERLRALLAYLEAEVKRRRAGKWRDPNPKPAGIPGLMAERDLVARQVQLHERLHALLEDARLGKAVGALLEKPLRAREIAADPRAYAAALGLELPSALEVQVEFERGTERGATRERVALRLRHYDRLAPFHLRWSADGLLPG